jgi:hypothetical protein
MDGPSASVELDSIQLHTAICDEKPEFIAPSNMFEEHVQIARARAAAMAASIPVAPPAPHVSAVRMLFAGDFGKLKKLLRWKHLWYVCV